MCDVSNPACVWRWSGTVNDCNSNSISLCEWCTAVIFSSVQTEGNVDREMANKIISLYTVRKDCK